MSNIHLYRTFNQNVFKGVSLLLFVLIACNCLGQGLEKKIDVQKLYEDELKKHLQPVIDSLNAKEVGYLSIAPEVAPNSALRIIEIDNKSYLEVRYLEKNIWHELLTSIVEHRYKPLSLKIHTKSVSISKSFKDKMVSIFDTAIALQKKRYVYNPALIYDGPQYYFKTNLNGVLSDAEVICIFGSSDYRNTIIRETSKIIDDIKQGKFCESNYSFSDSSSK